MDISRTVPLKYTWTYPIVATNAVMYHSQIRMNPHASQGVAREAACHSIDEVPNMYHHEQCLWWMTKKGLLLAREYERDERSRGRYIHED